MKMDREDNFRSSLEINERSRDVDISSVSALTCAMRGDEGPDEVFIPPLPLSNLPAEGSRDGTASNSCVTLSNGAADASSTKANPSSLDRHHGEKQLMAVQGEMDEVLRGTVSSSREPVDDTLLSNDGTFTPTASEDQTLTAFPTESYQENAEREDQDNNSGDEDSHDGREDVAVLGKADENSENETCPGQEGDETNYDHFCSIDEKDFKSLSYNLDSGSVETNVPTPSRLITNRDMVEQVDLSWRLATDIQQGEQLLQRLQMVQLRHDEIPNAPHGIKDGGVEGVSFRSKDEDERLKENSDSGEDEEESELNTGNEEETKSNLPENDKNEEQVETDPRLLSRTPELPEQNQIHENEEGESLDNQSESFETSDFHETSCPTIPFISTAHRLSTAVTSKERNMHEVAQGKQNLQRAEGLFNLADNPDVLEIPFKTDLSFESLLTQACTSQLSPWQFSEKKMQKEINQEIQRELVLVNQGKIPGDYSKGEVRQLKETKMLFEAFQQDNTKGPARVRVKEGSRKLPSEGMKGDVYPSVLERTRSLEMFSIKTCPVARAHSFRLNNSETTNRDKSPENVKPKHPDNLRSTSPENFRSKSPTGISRDKTRLSPYSKQEKHLRLHRSMDSISSEASTSAAKSRDKTREGDLRRESPILKQNPFFTLRPSLALQPEVAKDIREAREREEELRRQRCRLYGELRQKSEDEEKSRCTQMFRSEATIQSRGKLERIWPPPPKRDQKSEPLQQEVKVHRAGGQRAPLWQRWESGLINEQAADEKK